ncbi:MAG: hypothetical protein IPN95_31015 [Bacteroidetes bacterium]|nr:hypothetical protein [Bacteroidota bacterium]
MDKYWILTRALSHHEDWNKEIPQPIAEFLKNKGRNFTKIKTDISSLKSLDGFLKTQKGKTIARNKYNEIIRYDAFIVAPTPRMDSEEYKDLMELYREITETFFPAPIERKANNPEDLEKCFESSSEIQELTGFTRLFFPTRVHHARTGKADWSDRDVPDINDEEMKAMRKAVIFTRFAPSTWLSCEVAAKWLWEKVTFVVGLPKEMLPKVLRENYRKVLYVATKNIDKVSEIPQWLATKVEKNVLD